MPALNIKKFRLPKPVILAALAVGIVSLLYAGWLVMIDRPAQSQSSAASLCALSVKMASGCRPFLAVSAGKYTVDPQGNPIASDHKSQVLYHESSQRINRKVDAEKSYHTPGQVLSSDDKYFATRANTFLMLNWKPVSNWVDAGGGNATINAQIDAMADSIKSVAPAGGGKNILATFNHEPENDVSAFDAGQASCTSLKGSSGTPSQYVAMYRNIHNRFQARGVTNVVYAIDYMNYPPWDCIIDSLYPGDDYVDWIVFNNYFVANQTWSQILNHFYVNILTNHSNASTKHDYLSKDWGIAEWSARNTTEPQGVTYVNQAKASLEANEFPKLKIYMLFDNVGPEGNENRIAYNKDGTYSAAKSAAYNAYANSSVFGGSTPPPTDTTPPTVSVTAPSNGSTVSGTITLSANASDNVGVTDVKLYVDSTLIKDDTNGGDGWSSSWATTSMGNGAHTVKATAFDAKGNSATATVSIAINNPSAPVINSFTANPTSVGIGGKSTLAWSASNVSTCSVTPGGPTNTTPTSTWQTGALNATTTFTVTCGNASKTVTVTIVPAPSISLFKATPTSVSVGSTSTLSWTTANTVSCSITPGGPTNTTSTSWQTLTLSTTGTNTYTLTCKNSVDQTASATATVTVTPASIPPSSVVLSANPTTVVSGGTVTLTWTSNGSTSCTLNPGAFTASGTSSSKTITNLQTTTTYSVTCSNNAGSTTSSGVKVTVTTAPVPPPAPVIVAFTATPSSVASGATSVLAWQTSNVATSGCALTPSSLSSVSGNSQWTTPALTASISYTLSCKNTASVVVSKSVSVMVANAPAPAPPPSTTPGNTPTTGTITATTGQTVTNTQATNSVTQGDLATLEPSTVADEDTVSKISKVEFYNGNMLVETVNKAPFALDTKLLKPGDYTITQRTYYKDGSTLQSSQLVSIKKKSSHGLATVDVFIVLVGIGLAIAAALFVARRLAQHRILKLSSMPQGMIYGDVDLHDSGGPRPS